MKKNKSDRADEYLSKVIKRLEAENYNIESNIEYKNQYFEYVAKIKKFYIEKLNYFFTVFLFSKFSSLDIETLNDFISESFKYAAKATKRPMPYGIIYGRKIYPVAIADRVSRSASSFIRKKPLSSQIPSGTDMPVIYSLESGELCYSEASSFFTWLLEDEMRHDINHFLTP